MSSLGAEHRGQRRCGLTVVWYDLEFFFWGCFTFFCLIVLPTAVLYLWLSVVLYSFVFVRKNFLGYDAFVFAGLTELIWSLMFVKPRTIFLNSILWKLYQKDDLKGQSQSTTYWPNSLSFSRVFIHTLYTPTCPSTSPKSLPPNKKKKHPSLTWSLKPNLVAWTSSSQVFFQDWDRGSEKEEGITPPKLHCSLFFYPPLILWLWLAQHAGEE